MDDELGSDVKVCPVLDADQDAVEKRTGEVLDLLKARNAGIRPDPLQQGWMLMAIYALLKEAGLTDDEHFKAHLRAEKLADLELQLRNLNRQTILAQKPELIVPGGRRPA